MGNWQTNTLWVCPFPVCNAKWLKNGKLCKAILSAFYNISQRNFGMLLILWCSFKLWWNFCLDLLRSKFCLLRKWSTAGGNSLGWRLQLQNLKETLTRVSHYGIYVDKLLSLNLKLWWTRTLNVGTTLPQKYSVGLQEILSPGCAPSYDNWDVVLKRLYFVLDGFSSRRVGEEVRYTCRICGKVFNRAGSSFLSLYRRVYSVGLPWSSRQNKRLSLLRWWVRSAESRGFSPVSSHRESFSC
jgi:hypothetical protein